jgi:hypothetical protein
VREAVTAAPDLAIVEARDRAFTDRLADLRDDVDELGTTLASVRTGMDSPVAVYRAGVDLYELTTKAQQIVRVAHDLETELDAFEAWLNSAPRRHDALVDEVDAAESSAASVAETVETLQTAANPDPKRWFDATVQTLVLGVVVDDLRTETVDLREWANTEQKSFPTDVDDRIESLRDETTACASALEDRPNWEATYDTRLETLKTELAAVDPPVAWGQVDAHVAAAREGIGTGEPT